MPFEQGDILSQFLIIRLFKVGDTGWKSGL